MGYEINVAWNGRHFFATHERSIRNQWELQDILAVFMEKFPEAEGYEITVTKWEKTHQEMDLMEALRG